MTRAVLDTARRLRGLDDIRALVAESVQRGFTTPGRLRVELEAGSGRGSRLVRMALIEIEAGARSAVEGWGRDIGLEMEAREGFARIEWNVAVYAESGEFLFRPDGWVDEVAMAWELESVEYHLSPEDQERSYRRRLLMKEHDVELVEHRPRELRLDPGQVKADLRLGYARAARRPRPPLVVRRPG